MARGWSAERVELAWILAHAGFLVADVVACASGRVMIVVLCSIGHVSTSIFSLKGDAAERQASTPDGSGGVRGVKA
eukprot:9630185-Alexandrium_andersonii.AAC.1